MTVGIISLISMEAAGWSIGWNSSESMPTGLYLLSPVTRIDRDNLVAACIPKSDLTDNYMARGYLPSGDCPSGMARVLKPVAALAGDEVRIEEDGVTVNGVSIAGSQVADLDSHGRPLPHLPISWRQKLPTDSYFLLSTHSSRSLDSRYFGPVDRADVVYRARALMVF